MRHCAVCCHADHWMSDEASCIWRPSISRPPAFTGRMGGGGAGCGPTGGIHGGVQRRWPAWDPKKRAVNRHRACKPGFWWGSCWLPQPAWGFPGSPFFRTDPALRVLAFVAAFHLHCHMALCSCRGHAAHQARARHLRPHKRTTRLEHTHSAPCYIFAALHRNCAPRAHP